MTLVVLGKGSIFLDFSYAGTQLSIFGDHLPADEGGDGLFDTMIADGRIKIEGLHGEPSIWYDGKYTHIGQPPGLPPENWSKFCVSIWAGFRFWERRQVWERSGTGRSRSFASCVKRRCFSARG